MRWDLTANYFAKDQCSKIILQYYLNFTLCKNFKFSKVFSGHCVRIVFCILQTAVNHINGGYPL